MKVPTMAQRIPPKIIRITRTAQKKITVITAIVTRDIMMIPESSKRWQMPNNSEKSIKKQK